VVNFDKNWVEWNTVNNSEAIEKHRQKKELIEINVIEDDNELKGSSLSEAFKKKKKALIKRFESTAKSDNTNVNSTNIHENTISDEKKNSKNHTRNDIVDETNCTRSDFRNDTTTIVEILNDSQLKPTTSMKKAKSEKKKATKLNEVIKEEDPNEPPKSLIDRLIYGKKAELNEKEIKDVNKRLYSKLVENKERIKEEEINKKKQDIQKNKEKLKNYSENLKKNIIKPKK